MIVTVVITVFSLSGCLAAMLNRQAAWLKESCQHWDPLPTPVFSQSPQVLEYFEREVA